MSSEDESNMILLDREGIDNRQLRTRSKFWLCWCGCPRNSM